MENTSRGYEVTDEEDPVVKVRCGFQIASDHQAEWLEDADRYYNLYRAKNDQSQYRTVTRAQYVVPVCYKTVETILPRIMSVLFSAHPPVQSNWRITPPDSPFIMDPSLKDPQLKLRIVDQLFAYLFDKNGIFWSVECWIKDSLIYGQSYLKVGWKHRTMTKTETFPQVNPETGEIEDVESTSTVPVVDELELQNIDVRSMFFSPEAVFPDPFATAKYVIFKTQKRKSEIIALRDNGTYFDFDENNLQPDDDGETPKEKKATAINKNSTAMPDDYDPMINIYEYWEDDRLIVTAGREVLLRDEKNPYVLPGRAPKKPFISCFDNLIAGELFQLGEVEPLEHTQVEMSTLRRQRTDNNSIIINKMYLYNKNADVDIEAMKLARPGGGIGAAPPDGNLANAIVPINHGDINGASYREFEDLNQDAQDISGLVDYAVGSSPERRETATTVQLLQTAANQRFDLKIRNYSRAMKNLAAMIYEREKQLQEMPINLRVAIPGQLVPVFKSINKEDLPNPDDLDLEIPGSPGLLMKDARRQQMLQYIQMMQQMPTANPMAAHKMFVLALKEAEIDGIEPILALLEQPIPPMMPGQEGQPGANGEVPQPPSPPGFPGAPQMNEMPIMPLQPRPQN